MQFNKAMIMFILKTKHRGIIKNCLKINKENGKLALKYKIY